MATTIASFLASFNNELARPNRFDVQFNKTWGGIGPQQLTLRCETAELPSKTFATVEQKFGSNPIEKYPHQVNFNDLTLTFIVSGDMIEKKYFDAWMEAIVPSSNFDMNYKSDYSDTIVVQQYDLQNKTSYQVKMYEAYPVSVNQLDLDWSSDGHHKLTVVFAYTYWSNN